MRKLMEANAALETKFLSPAPWKVKFWKQRRILFVFSWLVVGGEETELRLLAKNLDPSRYQLDVVACFRKAGMPEQAHQQLEALGVNVDKTPYTLSFEDTIRYLAHKIPNYDIVVACQAVPDIYPAYEQLAQRPPLIEHGGLVCEALRGPKHFTTRYVGVCQSIRTAAATQMQERTHCARAIPSMVDLSEFDPGQRAEVRASWGITDRVPVFGWVGRLDRKKCVEDFINAAAVTHQQHPEARFIIIGGPDAFMPEYAHELQGLARKLNLLPALGTHEEAILRFLGDRPDVPRLMAGLDAFVWLSHDEGMPHVISEAGAAALPVIATRDNGSEEQITHGETGLFVAHRAPAEVATAMSRLVRSPDLRTRLGGNLRQKVEALYSAEAVVPQWQALFDEVLVEQNLEWQVSPPIIHPASSPKFVSFDPHLTSVNPKFG
jgi:polysaccharide biosynthesis protein PelF